MKICRVDLPLDNSELDVRKIADRSETSYFLPELKCWIKSDGEIKFDSFCPKMLGGECGFVKNENAQIFRMLIKLQEMKNYLIEILHTNTTLFTK